jgi:myo-inositol-1(or 4)-monophosphatase
MSELLEIARTIALEAGSLAAKRKAEGVEVVDRKSSSVDIVTAADRETEALIRSRLGELRPDDGFFGEESSAEAGTSGLTWIVDPIDGTVNFLYGIPHYAVSIAVVEGDPDPLSWRAIAGCVVNPAIGEVYTASAGGGAYLGDRRLEVAASVELSQALIATGFAYSAEERARQGAVIAALLPKVRDIRRMGTASLDLCAVATGRANAYYERTLSPWDHAAGALIAREAGAIVKGLGDAAPSRDFILAAAPGLAEVLEAELSALGI